jgi:hypothetical protein
MKVKYKHVYGQNVEVGPWSIPDHYWLEWSQW